MSLTEGFTLSSHRGLTWQILVRVGMIVLENYIKMLLKFERQKSQWQRRPDLPQVMGMDDSIHTRGPLAQ